MGDLCLKYCGLVDEQLLKIELLVITGYEISFKQNVYFLYFICCYLLHTGLIFLFDNYVIPFCNDQLS